MPRNPSPEVSVTTYSLRTELKAPLNQAIQAMGLKFVSELLAVVATHPDRAAAALKPIVEDYLAEKKTAKGKTASEMKKMLSGLTVEELRALVAATQQKDKASS